MVPAVNALSGRQRLQSAPVNLPALPSSNASQNSTCFSIPKSHSYHQVTSAPQTPDSDLTSQLYASVAPASLVQSTVSSPKVETLVFTDSNVSTPGTPAPWTPKAGTPTSDPGTPTSASLVSVSTSTQETDIDRNDILEELMSFFTQVAKITDHLFLCAAAGVTPTNVQQNGVTHIINLTLDVPALRSNTIETTRVAVDDVPGADLGTYFDRLTDKIRRVKERGGRTLVHCVAGVSRSASICIAYLMKYYRMPLLDAYRYVKGRRPVIRPNAGFFRQLVDYERRLFGKNTVRMVESRVGLIPDVYRDDYKDMVVFHPPPRTHHRRQVFR